MSRKSNLLLAVAGICIAAAALFVSGILRPLSHEPRQAETNAGLPVRSASSSNQARNSPDKVDKTSIADVSKLLRGTAQLPVTNERSLSTQFAQAKDISAFVSRAKATEGGLYFVRMALIHCGALDAKAKAFAISKAQQENKVEERTAAINSAFGACAGMPAGSELRAALMALNGASDRSISAAEEFGKHLAGNSETTTAEFVSRAVSYGNPELLAQMLTTIVPAAEANEKVEIVFNGKPVAKNDTGALALAMNLVACNYGLDCSGQSPSLISQCALGGPCGMDEYEVIRRYNLTPVEWDKASQFYAQTLEAYQLGNYGFINVVRRKS